MTATANPLAVHPSDRYLPVEGARLRYRDEGHGPAIILVHGWTLDLQMWDPQVAALSDALRLVRFDRRGHGLSSGRPSIERDATDIELLCTHLGLHRVALVGMSQGARAVLRFANLMPRRVFALVLDGPPDLVATAGDEAMEEDVPLTNLREILRARGLQAFRREWSGHALMQLRTSDPAMQRLVAEMIERYPGNDLEAVPPTEPGGRVLSVHSIAAPALVLSGAHDLPSRLRAAQQLCAQLPCAKRVIVRGAGHLINLDQPACYNELCRSFLTRRAH